MRHLTRGSAPLDEASRAHGIISTTAMTLSAIERLKDVSGLGRGLDLQSFADVDGGFLGETVGMAGEIAQRKGAAAERWRPARRPAGRHRKIP